MAIKSRTDRRRNLDRVHSQERIGTGIENDIEIAIKSRTGIEVEIWIEFRVKSGIGTGIENDIEMAIKSRTGIEVEIWIEFRVKSGSVPESRTILRWRSKVEPDRSRNLDRLQSQERIGTGIENDIEMAIKSRTGIDVEIWIEFRVKSGSVPESRTILRWRSKVEPG
ncbi:hypothetical protein EVAR_40792_1 [Eumeta japonica]|uniref:Uncharacterized protein n=1 Tax=Eumeta variegata TaxID=151549 RepID=A0A4C1X470_EUMVA|nr:hypothetical protein EVAR_40792_1 [Eumeta japonica]